MERQFVGLPWPPWEQLGKFGQRSHLEFMNAGLDALLDTLADNAEAWTNLEWQINHKVDTVHAISAKRLIDALRSISKGETA